MIPNLKSCALFRAINVIELDYPIEAAIVSALQVCDEAVVVVGQSQDYTKRFIYQLQEDYGRDKIKIVESYFHFDRGWQERWWNLASSYTDAEWLMWLDADEVIHEDDVGAIRSCMSHNNVELIRFPFLHFYATKDYAIKFALTHNTRMGRRSIGYRMVNWCTDQTPNHAACQAVFGLNGTQIDAHGWRGPNLVTVPAHIYHYGWCRNPHALAMSQRKHTAWYKDGDGLEDGHLPDVQPHPFSLKEKLANGQVSRWRGTHPAVMRDWFRGHRMIWKYVEKGEVRV